MKPSAQRLLVAFYAAALLALGAWLLFFRAAPPAAPQSPAAAPASAGEKKVSSTASSLPRPPASAPASSLTPSSPAGVASAVAAPAVPPPSQPLLEHPAWDVSPAAQEPAWLSQAEKLYEHEEPLTSGERGFRRITIRRVEMKYPLVRVIEIMRPDRAVVDRKLMVADHLMVQVKPAVSRADLEQNLARHGASIRKASPASDYYLISFPAGSSDRLPAVMQALQKEGAIAVAEPDYIQSASLTPNDTRFAQQWALHNTIDADIDAPEAWGVTQGSASVVVGVIDTGIDYLHPDLAGNIWSNPGEIPGNGIDDDKNGYKDDVRGWNFVTETADPMDDFFHGTHCAGTIGASTNNGAGVAGVCWNVKLMPLKFLNSSGSGFTSDAVDAINYATRQRVLLTSNSWGGGSYSSTLENAVKAARDAGILFIAAAGNSAVNNDLFENYPSNLAVDNVIAVAATDSRDLLASFSSYGLGKVHIAAPGVGILSTLPRTVTSGMTTYNLTADYGSISGTSMATPHVAGVCALLKSFRPGLTYQQIRAAVLTGGDRLPSLSGKVATGARVNASRSLELLDDLIITPLAGLEVNGPVGGPFTPSSGTLTVTNTGVSPANWSAAASDAWCSVSPGGGTLEPGESATLSIAITAAANSLSAGSRTSVITIQNLARGTAQTRLVSLVAEGVAPMPFAENWETGTQRSFWKSTGTSWGASGSFRNQITGDQAPRGSYHLVMDASQSGTLNCVNEMTVAVNLAGYTGVRLKFAAKSLNDEPHGPPSAGFLNREYFDGVAISADGLHWYEVQGLRALGSDYQDFDINLDTAVQSAGLSYTGTFKVRFCHYDNSSAPEDGICIDDIQITGSPPLGLVLTAPARLREGLSATCQVRTTVAQAQPTVVTLANGGNGRLSMPSTVVIPAMQTTAVFTIQAVDDVLLNGSEETLVAATAGGLTSGQALVMVDDNESAALSMILPASVSEGSGVTPEARVVVSKVPTRDIAVALSSSQQTQISVPPLVMLAAGTTEVSFPLMVIDDQRIEGFQTVSIGASVPNWTSANASVMLTDDETFELHLSLPASLDRFSGTVANGGTVRLDGTLTSDLIVTLASSAPAEISVPAQVVIPAGNTGVSFDLVVAENANLPGTASVQITAASIGFMPDTAGVALNAAVSRVWTLSQATSDLVYSATTGSLIATVPASASLINGGLAFIAPSPAQVASVLPVAGELKMLRIADDGASLWAASSNGQTLLRLSAATGAVSTSISLGADPLAGSYTAVDLAVMPGAPGTIAVARRLSGIVPHHAGVALFDSGVMRPSATPRAAGSTAIEFVTASSLAGYDQETGEHALRLMEVTAGGASINSTTPGVLAGAAVDIVADGGLLYSTSGKVIDPATMQVIRSVAVTGPVCPDQSANRVCWLQQSGPGATLHVFDQTGLNAVGTVVLSGLSGQASSLVRCGADRIAFRTSGGQIFVVRTAHLGAAGGPRLVVTPAQDALLVRYAGGSSSPTAASFTLVNPTASAVDWALAKNSTWIDLSAVSGTLPARATTIVSATPNADSLSLPSGTHKTVLTFTNTTDGVGGTTREVTLDLRPANTVPVVSAIPDQISNGDLPVGPLAFTVSDAETDAASLVVSASSSNPTLIPDSAITLSGSGSSRAVALKALPNRSGTAVITLAVSDPGSTTTSSFTVTVNAVNDPPTISTISGQAAVEDLSVTGVAFTVSDPESPTDDLIVSATSSNTTLLPVSRIFLGGSGSSRQLSLQPMPNQNGSTVVTLKVSDGELFATTSFTYTVTAVNDPPTLEALNNLSFGISPGLQTVSLQGITTGAANEVQTLSLTAVSSNPSVVPNPSVSYTSPASSGSLSFTPVAGASGAAVITVTLSDNGGTALGGFNQIVRTFAVRVGVPVITSVAPASGPVGSLVTIDGSGFDSAAGGNTVYFGAVKAEVFSASASKLAVVVPPGATQKPVSVTARGLTAWSQAPFKITFPNTRPLGLDCFGPVQNLPRTIHSGFLERRVLLVDLDGDGKNDIFAKGSTGMEYTKNNVSDGVIHPSVFSPPVTVDFFTTITGMASWDYGDLNGDGRLDLVVTGDQGAYWFKNESTPGTIALGPRTALNNYYTYFVQIADMDQDGRPDIVTNENGQGVAVYRNTSTGGVISFAAKFNITGSSGASHAIADMDGDGKPDIVSDNGTTGLQVFRNQSTGTLSASSFAAGVPLSFGVRTYSVCVSDLNGDLRPDIMVTGFTTTSAISNVAIFQNNCTPGVINTGTFSARQDLPTRPSSRFVDVADFDGNGRPDIIVTSDGYGSEHSSTSVLMNYTMSGAITAATFGPRQDLYTEDGVIGGSPAADLDGDGKPEIVTSRAGQVINVWKNQFGDSRPVVTSIAPDAGPAGCQVVVTGTGFSTSAEGNTVYLGPRRAKVLSASSTSLLIEIPAGTSADPVAVTVNGTTGYSPQIFKTTIASTQVLAVSSFGTGVAIGTGTTDAATYENPVSIGDLDGDGKNDVVISRTASGTLQVYRNIHASGALGAASFAAPVTLTCRELPWQNVLRDIDGDGKLDICVTSSSAGLISVFRNQSTSGTMVFAPRFDSPALGGTTNYVECTDINADGRLDFVIGDNQYSTSRFFTLLNTSTTGTVSFQTPVTYDLATAGGIPLKEMAIKDFDGDGRLDYCASAQSHAVLGLGTGTTTAPSFGAPTLYIWRVGGTSAHMQCPDLDGDGRPDIVGHDAGSSVNQGLSIGRNICAPGAFTLTSFAWQGAYANISRVNPILAVDMDADGRQDIIVPEDASSKVAIFQNFSTIANIGLAPIVELALTHASQWCAAGDLNGDGKKDIVASGSNKSLFTVLQNNSTNAGPSIMPIAAQSVLEDHATSPIPVQVSDVGTPLSSLVVTAASSNLTLVPPSGVVIGGSGSNRTLQLTPVPDGSGQSTITVQVSDGSLTASTSFVLTVIPVNDAPTIAGLAPVVMPASATTLDLPVTGITTGAPDEAQALKVQVSSGGAGLLAEASINYNSPGGSAVLHLTPSAVAQGTTSLSVTVSDNGGTANGGQNTTSLTIPVTIVDNLEWWKRGRWSAAELQDASVSGDNADPKKTGFTNLLRYAMKLDTDADLEKGVPVVNVVTIAGQDYATFSYRRRLDDNLLFYDLETSSDLLTWQSVGGGFLQTGTVANGDGSETVTLRSVSPLAPSGSLLLRLKVSRDSP